MNEIVTVEMCITDQCICFGNVFLIPRKAMQVTAAALRSRWQTQRLCCKEICVVRPQQASLLLSFFCARLSPLAW
jgi:hypothetical protein